MENLGKIHSLKTYLLKHDWFRVINNFKKSLSFQIIANFNKSIGRTYIPNPRNVISIEATSLCNLKCKFCAYDKRDEFSHPIKTMPVLEFKEVLNKCTDENYKYIGLTPTTGDVFMDKNIFEKMDILEDDKKILGFDLYTNFIPIKTELIYKLFTYKKLIFLGLSIYGDDLESFKAFADSKDSAYLALVRNLKKLNEIVMNQKVDTPIRIGHRTRKNFDLETSNSKVSIEIKKLLKVNNTDYIHTKEFNNWGGIIKDEHVSDLNINFNKDSSKKVGACALIFSRNQIGSNLDLNACACRDANYTLKLGNLKDSSLGELLSKKNPVYSKLIDDQNNGNFSKVCKSCDFYQSIYVPQGPMYSPKQLVNSKASSESETSFRHYQDSYISKLEDFYKIIN